MRLTALTLLLMLLADVGLAAPCQQKRSRDPTFIELVVPDDAIRPSGAGDFAFVNDDTTVDQLFARVGPPDAAAGTSGHQFIYCFADGTELRVYSRDRVAIDAIRHEGKAIFKRKRK